MKTNADNEQESGLDITVIVDRSGSMEDKILSLFPFPLVPSDHSLLYLWINRGVEKEMVHGYE
jgi:hypothetical protein